MSFLTPKNIEKFSANYAVMAVFVILLIKLVGWTSTNSLSIFTSLIDSSLDILVSVLNAIAIRYALKPSDDDHKFGHTAIEDIVGIAQAVFIVASGVFIFFEGINRFANPGEIENNSTGIWIIITSTLITLSIILVQKYAISKTKSQIIEADSLHYTSDFLSGILIVVSLFFTGKAGYFLDIAVAFLISVYLVSGAWKIGFRSFNNLMGKEADDKTVNEIKSIIQLNSQIIGFHDLKTRYMGRKLIIVVDIEVLKTLDMVTAHSIADELEKTLKESFGDIEVTIHIDPHD